MTCMPLAEVDANVFAELCIKLHIKEYFITSLSPKQLAVVLLIRWGNKYGRGNGVAEIRFFMPKLSLFVLFYGQFGQSCSSSAECI